MRRTVCVGIVALLLIPALCRGEIIEDFSQESGWYIHGGEEKGGALSLSPAPGTEDIAAGVRFAAEHATFLELHNSRARTIETFEQDLRGLLTFRVYLEAGSPVRRVALRLLDAGGEVFQWSELLPSDRPGWQEMSYRIAPDSFTGNTWGQKVDGVIDLPVRLLGFAVSFDMNVPGPGVVYIDDIRATGFGSKVDVSRPLWSFDRSESWWLGSGGPQHSKVEQQNDGLLLTCSPREARSDFPLLERQFPIRNQGDPDRITLQAELLAGDGIEFNVRVRDARGEVFQFEPKPLKPGMNLLEWRLKEEDKGSWGDNKDDQVDPPLHLHELWVVRQASAREAKVKLIAGTIISRQPMLEAVAVELQAGNAVHVIDADTPTNPVLRLRNNALEPVEFRAEARLEDFFGNTIPATKRFSLKPQTEADWELPTPNRLGHWRVSYALSDAEDSARIEGQRSFAFMHPAGPTEGKPEGFLFSICTHTERWPTQDQEREVLAAALCGAKVIRTGVGWGGIQPDEQTWNWDHMDRIVRMYEEKGMEIQYLTAFTPRWAAPEQFRDQEYSVWRGKQPRLDAWRKYISAVASRYKDKIRYWEIWNEPDIGFWMGTLDEYLEILQAAYEEIKKVDPELRVMTGGFACYDRNPDFVEGVIARAPQYFDILAWHRHGEFDGFRDEVDGPLANLRGKLDPPKPLYFNETAVSSVFGQERMQAETLFKKLTFSWSRGSIGYTWYDLRNDGFDPKDWEHNYGMVTNDFYPKPVYVVFNTLSSLLTDKEYLGEIDLGPKRYAYVFGNEKEQIIAAWSDAGLASGEQVVLDTDAGGAKPVDIMGNAEETLACVDGKAVLTLTRVPAFLVLDGARQLPKAAGSLVSVPGLSVAVRGRSMRVSAEFNNPFDRARDVALTWELPAALGGSKLITSARIPAGGTETVPLDVEVPGDANVSYGDVLSLKLSYRIAGTQWRGTMVIPVHVAALIPAGGTDRAPDFALQEPSRMRNLFEADPNKAHLIWKGPEDLSAQVWLARAGGNLSVQVRVRDDKHVQDQSGEMVWQGDGIQLAFEVPGQEGYWELGLTRLADGSPEVFNWLKPPGFADPSGDVKLTVSRDEDTSLTTYEALLPRDSFGLSDDALDAGIRFNLLVNDNDGEGRESWAHITDGIGVRKDPALFPFVVFAR